MTFVRQGDWEAAKADFLKADPDQDGKVQACLAYCYTQVKHRPRFDLAFELYQKAVAQGYATAVIYNNMGHCCFRDSARLYPDKGMEYLEKAIQLDPHMQVAYHNLALLDLRIATGKDRLNYVPERGINAVRQALKVGEGYGQLYHDAAVLCDIAAQRKRDKSLEDEAVRYVAKAVKHGVPFLRLKFDFGSKPAFADALKTRAEVPFRQPEFSLYPVPHITD
jgi:tetratricopeptide (TPR) repeat protein